MILNKYHLRINWYDWILNEFKSLAYAMETHAIVANTMAEIYDNSGKTQIAREKANKARGITHCHDLLIKKINELENQ